MAGSDTLFVSEKLVEFLYYCEATVKPSVIVKTVCMGNGLCASYRIKDYLKSPPECARRADCA